MKHVRPSTMEDCLFVAKNMREEDIAELKASTGLDPLSALLTGLTDSDVCLTMIEPSTGDPAGMLGVTPGYAPMFGAIWLLGTPAIERNPITFLRHSKPVLQHLYEVTGYEAFYNYTHKPNELHHKWLRWLGFSFLREVQFNDDSFYEFVRLRG